MHLISTGMGGLVCRADFFLTGQRFLPPLPGGSQSQHGGSGLRMTRVGQNHYIYGAYTVFLARKLPYIRSYTVYIYGSGQPYV